MSTYVPDTKELHLNQGHQLGRHALLLKIIQANLVCTIVRLYYFQAMAFDILC